MARIEPRPFTLKAGETCVVRSAGKSDADVLLAHTRRILVPNSHRIEVGQPRAPW